MRQIGVMRSQKSAESAQRTDLETKTRIVCSSDDQHSAKKSAN